MYLLKNRFNRLSKEVKHNTMSQQPVSTKTSLKSMILADLLTLGRYGINLIFFVILFMLLLEIKSILQIDIFPNYDFPLDEMVRELF